MSESEPSIKLPDQPHPLVEKLGVWIQKNYRPTLIVLVLFLLSFLILQKFSSSQKEFEKQHLLSLFHEIGNLEKLEADEFETSFYHIEEGLAAFPSLWDRFSGPLAQVVIKKGRADLLLKISPKIEGINSNYFKKFVNISLLIESEKYEEALRLSEELKINLEKFGENLANYYHYLSSYNYFRICFLYKQLGDNEKELNAIQTFLALDQSPILNASIKELKEHFSNGSTTLDELLAIRKEALHPGNS